MAETLTEASTEFLTKALMLLDEPNEELDEELDEDEVKFDVNGDEIITEEYEPDFDDDEFYHQMHAHNHDDFGYRPFGCGDLL